MMVYIRNTVHIYKMKKIQNFILILGIQKSVFQKFPRKKLENKLRIRGISRPAQSRIRHRAKRKLWRAARNSLRSANEKAQLVLGTWRRFQEPENSPRHSPDQNDFFVMPHIFLHFLHR